ncbi:unnamed protein product, partial [Ectocarpus sp. 12 AP-2014]
MGLPHPFQKRTTEIQALVVRSCAMVRLIAGQPSCHDHSPGCTGGHIKSVVGAHNKKHRSLHQMLHQLWSIIKHGNGMVIRMRTFNTAAHHELQNTASLSPRRFLRYPLEVLRVH